MFVMQGQNGKLCCLLISCLLSLISYNYVMTGHKTVWSKLCHTIMRQQFGSDSHLPNALNKNGFKLLIWTGIVISVATK